jgi:hypothetical protein
LSAKGPDVVSLRDTLDRFRPVATPGAPGRRGVPVDRVAERESELAPLFAFLVETERAAAEIRQRAVAEADRVRCDARLRAEALVAEARVRVEALRSDAAAHARASADEERARARLAARTVTVELSDRAAERLPDLVARAVSLARTELGAARAGPS